MNQPDLSQTTVLYALSALAQACAALVGFLGAIAIYQRQTLGARAQAILNQLNQLTFDTEYGHSPFARLIPSRLRNIENIEEVKRLHDLIHQEMGPQARRARRVFIIFISVNLAVIFLSFVGFRFVELLATGAKYSLWLLALLALAACISTFAMALELVGALAGFLTALHLSCVRTLLEAGDEPPPGVSMP